MTLGSRSRGCTPAISLHPFGVRFTLRGGDDLIYSERNHNQVVVRRSHPQIIARTDRFANRL